MDKFWESLGFKIPFEFPACQVRKRILWGTQCEGWGMWRMADLKLS